MENTDLLSVIADYDNNFKSYWKQAFDELNSGSFDNCFWVTGPTSYLFSLSGLKFAVDLQVRREKDLEAISETLKKDCSRLPFVLITHQHGDHMCFPLINLLKDTDTLWYLPYGTQEKYIKRSGLSNDKIVFIKDGDDWEIGGVKFRAFYSPHKLADDEPFPQLGYEITAGNTKILMPSDVRDYDYDNYPKTENVDFCFSNLWAGRDALTEQKYLPMLEKFARFNMKFGAKKYFLCHLYEIGRLPVSMWTESHAETAIEFMKKLSPKTPVEILRLGKRYPLGEE